MSIPRFDLPLRYYFGKAVTNDQGSIDDISSKVYAACATEPGWFEDEPSIGLGDLTFSQEPISASEIAQALSHSVPDANILVDVAPSRLEEAAVNAGIEVKV